MDDNTFKLLTVLIGAVVSLATIGANLFILRTRRDVGAIHELVNSNQAEFRQLVKSSSHAAGMLEGVASVSENTAPALISAHAQGIQQGYVDAALLPILIRDAVKQALEDERIHRKGMP